MLPSIENSTLLVIDIQERLLPAMHQGDQERLIKETAILLQAFREFGGNAVVSEQYPKGLGHTVEGLTGFIEGWPCLEKTHFSLCQSPEYSTIEAHVQKDVVLAGIEAHVCVLQTGCDLLEKGHRVWVPFDAVSSRAPAYRDNGLALLERAGAVIINTESLVFNQLQSAGSDAFKRFSKLIR